ncbi:MAG TPA: hypothetical protein VH092_13435 [Urbifossiella sp.]|jgi:hypothetical protein|nr:hypothetical protein [Urbifossiella sp.]
MDASLCRFPALAVAVSGWTALGVAALLTFAGPAVAATGPANREQLSDSAGGWTAGNRSRAEAIAVIDPARDGYGFGSDAMYRPASFFGTIRPGRFPAFGSRR